MAVLGTDLFLPFTLGVGANTPGGGDPGGGDPGGGVPGGGTPSDPTRRIDIRRIVTLAADGTATIVKNLEDTTNYAQIQGTFQVRPGTIKPVWAERQRRFGGSTAVGETQDNGAVTWTIFVRGSTADLALAHAEQIFAVLRQPRRDLFFQWAPVGATQSTFYEIRGPAAITPTYEARQFADSRSWRVEVEIPIAPLAFSEPATAVLSSASLPAVVHLTSPIPGSAPALANITLRTSGGSAAPVWAMFAWVKRPAVSPLPTASTPFGILYSEDATNLTTFSSQSDATYLGSSGLKATTSGAGSGAAQFPIDPSVLDVDDWAVGDVDVEVYARLQLASTLVSPRVKLSLLPTAGTNYGAQQWASEYGSVGKSLTRPSSGTAFRLAKLGTLSLPVDKSAPLSYSLRVDASWAAGSSGTFGIDYLWVVPSRQRALSPTAKPNDTTYPRFIKSTGDTRKRIMGADLSGRVSAGAGNFGRDSGLGGSPIELPPGNVDLLLKLSSVVPDDPSSSAVSEQLSHTGVSGEITVWPRFWLTRGGA